MFFIAAADKQGAIVAWTSNQASRIDAAMAADRRAIELLQEFHTRLIADVVTGKLDVRDVAATLPDEPPEEESEPLEKNEELTEGAQADGGADLEPVDEVAEAMDLAERQPETPEVPGPAARRDQQTRPGLCAA